jgi:phosphoribosyl 1,2-cyclic phosphodiesterase
VAGSKARVASKSHSEKHPPAHDRVRHTVTFWGVRGTLPTPGANTLRYGGNTSCLEVHVEAGGETANVILDAGSGIAGLGDHAVAKGQREFHILLSHVHYDHIIGLTRFLPLFRKDCRVHFYGRGNSGKGLHDILQSFFTHPFFPVEFDRLGANPNLTFHTLDPHEEINLGPVRIRCQDLNHPQGAVGFRIETKLGKSSLVYATDHEHGTPLDNKLASFAHETTLFLYDSTYHNENYRFFKGFGHSTAHVGASLAAKAKVGAYGLFHHDSQMSDDALEKISLPEAMAQFPNSFLCREGMTIDLEMLAENPEIFFR